MPARCVAHLPGQASRAWSLREEVGAYVLGRDPAAELEVADDRISRRHARFAWDGEQWTVADLGSKNGIVVDGAVTAAAVLAGEHWIDAGGILLRFEVLDAATAARRVDEELGRWRSAQALCGELTAELEPPQLLERLLTSTLALAGLERGFVLRRRDAAAARDTEDGFEVVSCRGLALEELASPQFRGSVGAVERVLAEGAPVATSDASLDTWLGARASVLGGGIRGLVCLPLAVSGDLLGALYADSRRPGTAVTELDVEILAALADHAALVLSLVALRREVRELAALAGAGVDAGDETVGVVPSPGEAPSWRRLVGEGPPP